jgi:pyruvate/2-oxoglutarate dehydrogenase complex dihydrolipoamide acyltransferase (E2) component
MIGIGRAGRARVSALAVLAVLGVTALGACGGGSDKGGVASLSGKSTSDTQASAKRKQPTQAEIQAAFQQFAQCMREHGIDMPDPKVSGGKGQITIGGQGKPQDQQQLDAAQKACQHFIDVVQGGKRDLDPAKEKKLRDQALKFAKCMRDHGINMPDPQFQSGGRVSQRLDANPNDPKFQAAQKECQKLAPSPIGGKGPGGSTNSNVGGSGGSGLSVTGGGA